MPATPKLALPYPVTADTADVPRDIKALADRIELTSAAGQIVGTGATQPLTATPTTVAGLSAPITVPAGCRALVTCTVSILEGSTSFSAWTIWDGGVQVGPGAVGQNGGAAMSQQVLIGEGAHTITVKASSSGASGTVYPTLSTISWLIVPGA